MPGEKWPFRGLTSRAEFGGMVREVEAWSLSQQQLVRSRTITTNECNVHICGLDQ